MTLDGVVAAGPVTVPSPGRSNVSASGGSGSMSFHSASRYRRRDSRTAVPSVVSTVTLSISAIMIGRPSPRGGSTADTRQAPVSRTTIGEDVAVAPFQLHRDRWFAVFEAVVDRLTARQHDIIGFASPARWRIQARSRLGVATGPLAS